MTVRLLGNTIYLQGRCPADDAEPLLLALQESPDRLVDLTGAQRMHTAVVQLLIALSPPVRGSPKDPFLCRYIFGAATAKVTTRPNNPAS